MWCMYSSIVYVIRISFVGRGSVCSSSQNTVGPICKNPPTIRLKKLWNWLMSATIWHIFSMRHKQWTETEIISIWWNLLEKIREINSGEIIFGGFKPFWTNVQSRAERSKEKEREESARQSSSNRVSWSTAPQLIKAAHKSLVKARKVAERDPCVVNNQRATISSHFVEHSIAANVFFLSSTYIPHVQSMFDRTNWTNLID